ncbi:hypothetical protein HY496_01060 [Candidatus Woesearchaeota archaeon]|nr:hypothetical protein [Candidatus Woesearchaeota archaeon]
MNTMNELTNFVSTGNLKQDGTGEYQIGTCFIHPYWPWDQTPYQIPWQKDVTTHYTTTILSSGSRIEKAYKLVQALMTAKLLKLTTIEQFIKAVDVVAENVEKSEKAYSVALGLMKAKSVKATTIEEFTQLVDAVSQKL